MPSRKLPPAWREQVERTWLDVRALGGCDRGKLVAYEAKGHEIALAKRRAVVVLPVPRGPVKRYAWATRPARIAFCRVVVIWSWPITSANVCGRHLRYRETAGMTRSSGG